MELTPATIGALVGASTWFLVVVWALGMRYYTYNYQPRHDTTWKKIKGSFENIDIVKSMAVWIVGTVFFTVMGAIFAAGIVALFA